jgi:hypothetical protein
LDPHRPQHDGQDDKDSLPHVLVHYVQRFWEMHPNEEQTDEPDKMPPWKQRFEGETARPGG